MGYFVEYKYMPFRNHKEGDDNKILNDTTTNYYKCSKYDFKNGISQWIQINREKLCSVCSILIVKYNNNFIIALMTYLRNEFT